jgi:hypothetical protein
MTANLICFTRTPERTVNAVRELARVGVDGVRKWYGFPNPFDRLLLNAMPHTSMMDDNIGYFNCSVSHYRAIKTALELGERNILVCEDDVRFRKDIRSLADVVDSAPEYDVLLLDAIPPGKANGKREFDIAQIDLRWATFSSMRSAACYMLSRKGMERIVWLYESAADRKIAKRKARICDQWFERKMLPGLKLVMAHPNVAVQQTVPGKHNSGNSWRLRGYEALGIDLSDYSDYA